MSTSMEGHYVVLEKREGHGYGFAIYYDEDTNSHRVRHIQSGSVADQPGHLHVGDRLGTMVVRCCLPLSYHLDKKA